MSILGFFNKRIRGLEKTIKLYREDNDNLLNLANNAIIKLDRIVQLKANQKSMSVLDFDTELDNILEENS